MDYNKDRWGFKSWNDDTSRGGAAKFPNRSILLKKYNFGFRSTFFGPISVYFCNFHRCFGLVMNLLVNS